MRWLSLLAVLTGCSLLTNPDQFEELDGTDAGDSGRDGSVDGAVDSSVDSMTDSGPCVDGDIALESLEICVDGMWTPCDGDGDGFVDCEISACMDVDTFPPCDCAPEDALRRGGLSTCEADPLVSCVGLDGVFRGNNAGQVAFHLDALSGGAIAEPPPRGSLALVSRGPGQYDVVYTVGCTGAMPGCAGLRQTRFTYQPPWQITAEDDALVPPSFTGTRILRFDTGASADIPVLAVMGAGDRAALFTGDFRAPALMSVEGMFLPFVAAGVGVELDPRMYWIRRGAPTELSWIVEGDAARGFAPPRALSELAPHPMDAAGAYVVLLGDGEHQFWAAPPLADTIDFGVCEAATGCLPIRVGGSIGALTVPNGPPTVIALPDGLSGVGVFPVIASVGAPVEGNVLMVQRLIAGCEEMGPGSPTCTDPLFVPATAGGNIHDSASIGQTVFIAFLQDDTMRLVSIRTVPETGAVAASDFSIPLFTDGLITRFDRVDAIRLSARLDGTTLEIATLVVGTDSVLGPGLYLDILRVCAAGF